MTDTISRTDQTRAVVEGLYAAGAAGDVAGVLAALSDEVLVVEPPFLAWGGVYTGHAGFTDLFSGLLRKLDLSKLAIDHIVTQDDTSFVVFHCPDTITGADVHIAEESVVHDGKIVKMTVYYHDAPAYVETRTRD